MTSNAPARGRPRDPGLEDRVYDAVLEVYGDLGWSGFTLDAVARRAAVGRSALYRRWDSKAALLAAALERRAPRLPPVDTGSLVGDLTLLAADLMDNYTQPAGLSGLRAILDARTHPELLEQLSATLNGERFQVARAVVRNAIRRGELPEGTSVTLAVELVAGATLSHVLFAPAAPRAGRRRIGRDVYAARIATAVARALGG